MLSNGIDSTEFNEDDNGRKSHVPGDSRKFVLLKNVIKRSKMNIPTISLNHFEKKIYGNSEEIGLNKKICTNIIYLNFFKCSI